VDFCRIVHVALEWDGWSSCNGIAMSISTEKKNFLFVCLATISQSSENSAFILHFRRAPEPRHELPPSHLWSLALIGGAYREGGCKGTGSGLGMFGCPAKAAHASKSGLLSRCGPGLASVQMNLLLHGGDDRSWPKCDLSARHAATGLPV
jgi:hypothetical protein